MPLLRLPPPPQLPRRVVRLFCGTHGKERKRRCYVNAHKETTTQVLLPPLKRTCNMLGKRFESQGSLFSPLLLPPLGPCGWVVGEREEKRGGNGRKSIFKALSFPSSHILAHSTDLNAAPPTRVFHPVAEAAASPPIHERSRRREAVRRCGDVFAGRGGFCGGRLRRPHIVLSAFTYAGGQSEVKCCQPRYRGRKVESGGGRGRKKKVLESGGVFGFEKGEKGTA